MIGLPSSSKQLPDTNYILSMSFDPCQITSSLRYEFTRASDGSPHRKAVYGLKAGCYCFEPEDTMLVQVYALCSRDPSVSSLPGIKVDKLVLTLNDYEFSLPMQKCYTGDFYIMFEATELYTFAPKSCQWPLKANLNVWIDGVAKTYKFDPEVIVGDGETE